MFTKVPFGVIKSASMLPNDPLKIPLARQPVQGRSRTVMTTDRVTGSDPSVTDYILEERVIRTLGNDAFLPGPFIHGLVLKRHFRIEILIGGLRLIPAKYSTKCVLLVLLSYSSTFQDLATLILKSQP
jgi:hypothetical protein